MGLKISIVTCVLIVLIATPFLASADEFDAGIELEDGISVEDALTPEINYTFIKRYAVQKAKVLGDTEDVDDVEGIYDDYSRTAGIGNVNLAPGTLIKGDVYIVIDADTLNAIDTN